MDDGPHAFTASAPCRLDFAGGWTDVEPFASEQGGLVVNAAIDLHARAEVTLHDHGYELRSDDLDRSVTLHSPDDSIGELPLLHGALRMVNPGSCIIRTSSQAPPGSGLGSSGAMGVAIISALDRARGGSMLPPEIAEAAWRAETVHAAVAGGKQDQYAAAFGGFNLLRFSQNDVRVDPIDLSHEFLNHLARRTIICYTGQSRFSSNTITRVMQAYQRRDPLVTNALLGMRDIAERMDAALRNADFAKIGALLSENWRAQQQLDPAMCTPEMAALEREMIDAGALGGKAAGSGAGGVMFFVMRDDAARVVGSSRGTIIDFVWSSRNDSMSSRASEIA